MAAYIVLLTIRQYEGKSYRLFAEWLVEAYYLRIFLSDYHTYHTLLHCRNLHKESTVHCLKRYSLFLHHSYKSSTDICWGIDSSGFKVTHASQYYTERTRVKRRKYIKLSLGADVLKQIICAVKIRRVLL